MQVRDQVASNPMQTAGGPAQHRVLLEFAEEVTSLRALRPQAACANIGSTLVSVFDRGLWKGLYQTESATVSWTDGILALRLKPAPLNVHIPTLLTVSLLWARNYKKPLPPTLSPSSPLLRRPKLCSLCRRDPGRNTFVFRSIL